MIIDYSLARPPMAQLKSAGVTAVGRYLGWDGEPGFQDTHKNLTAAEVSELHAAGIAVFTAFEYDPKAPANGGSQGRKDGELATRQLADLGAPPLIGVYFACDWDIQDYAPHVPDTKSNAEAKLGPIAGYFQSINELVTKYRVGAYGGYYAVKRLFDAGLISLGWQTIAWSGGQRDTRAQLYQTGTTSISGTDLNVHEGSTADFGQWNAGAGGGGTGHPTLQQGFTGQAVKDLQTALNHHGATISVDGVFGPATKSALEAFQHSNGLAADGIAGPLTWAKLA